MATTLRRLVPKVLRTVLGTTLVVLAVPAIGCDDGGSARATPTPGSDATASVERISTEDGLTLDARLFAASSPDRLVILLHMYPADQRAWWQLAEQLQERGIAALTLDFRGYGASEGGKDPPKIDRDVRAAVTFARSEGYRRIVLLGASMGGTAALAAADGLSVDSIVTMSAPSEFRGLDAQSAMASMAVPVALISAEGDVSAAHSLEVLAEAGAVRADRQLLVGGAAHGTDLLVSPQSGEVTTWLFAYLDELFGPTSAERGTTRE